VLLVVYLQTSGMMPMTEAAVAHVVSRGGVFDTQALRPGALVGFAGLHAGCDGRRLLGMSMWAWPAFPLIVSLSLAALLVFAFRMPDVKEAARGIALNVGPASFRCWRQPVVRWFFASVFFHILSHIGHLQLLLAVSGLRWAIPKP